MKFIEVSKSMLVGLYNFTNEKMSSVIQFAFNAVELYVVTVNGKHWTRAKKACKALEYQR